MSSDRFKFVVTHLTFDDVKQRAMLWKSDRFAAFRAMFEKVNKNCSKWLEPSEFLSLDETLYPMRHQMAFRQYNPDKPAKYGLLFKSINDARYPYTYTSAVYAGKPEAGQGPHYISGTENIVKHLIEKLQSSQNLQGRNISMDRLYTSYSLFQWLLSNNITAVGTLMSNRHGVPDELKSAQGFAEFESQVYWEQSEKKVVLSSYTVKTKSKGSKNVLIMSTIQPLQGVTHDDGKKKPALYKLYDFTKGGTDIVDQRMGGYTCKAKSRKWSMVAFYFIIDESRVNASTVLAIKEKQDPRSIDSFEFGWELGMSLVKPCIQRRSASGLSVPVQMKIQFSLGEYKQPANDRDRIIEFEAVQGTKRRCKMCIGEIKGQEDYKEK
eukprot:Seg4924.2 transcript_id=Seg4924.2/GoldUCD/mRNA.D3Y31 product="PiggyBac transposable element-derived protein 2" protein_id=Seg4924.2/GoldUCD/D3Y31